MNQTKDDTLLTSAEIVLGDAALAEKWLARPSQLYQGRTPAEALITVEGAIAVGRQLRWFAGPHLIDLPPARAIAA